MKQERVRTDRKKIGLDKQKVFPGVGIFLSVHLNGKFFLKKFKSTVFLSMQYKLQ